MRALELPPEGGVYREETEKGNNDGSAQGQNGWGTNKNLKKPRAWGGGVNNVTSHTRPAKG